MNAVRFNQEAVQRLLKKIWAAKERYTTQYDRQYDTYCSVGLPCVAICIEDYGVYLSGNCRLDDSEEVWALDYDPNEREDLDALQYEVRELFGETPQRIYIHLHHQYKEGDELIISIDDEADESGSRLNVSYVQASVKRAWSNDDVDMPSWM